MKIKSEKINLPPVQALKRFYIIGYFSSGKPPILLEAIGSTASSDLAACSRWSWGAYPKVSPWPSGRTLQ